MRSSRSWKGSGRMSEWRLVPLSSARWIWPLRIPADIARRSLRLAQWLGERMGPWPWWLVAGLFIGASPLLVDYATGWVTCRLISALLLTPLLLAAVARDSLARAM